MNSIIKKLALCAFLGASGSALAVPVLMPNGDFSAGSTSWTQNGAGTTFSYPASGGNPDGYGVMDQAAGGGWGIWVGNGDAIIPLDGVLLPGVTAGNSYVFKQDMRIEGAVGTNIGGFKVDFFGGPGGSTGDLRVPKIGDGSTWETYSYTVSIPAGVTGIRIVPLWGVSSIVGYDNFRVENGSVPLVPGIPNPGFEIPDGASWAPVSGGGTTTYSYPTTGGNPGGYGVMTNTSGWGIWVSNSDSFLTVGQLSLTPGQTYNFTVDMKIFSGVNIGKYKIDFAPGGSTGDLTPAISGDGSSWATYTFSVLIPIGTTGLKIVPVAGAGSSVGFDNFTVSPPPAPLPPQATIAPATQVKWTPDSLVNSYQAQQSVDDIVYTNIGPAIIGNAGNSAFTAGQGAFYRVMASVPGVQQAIYNGGFTEEQLLTPTAAEGWNALQSQPPTRLLTGGRGDDGPCMQIKVLNVGAAPSGSEIQQNTKNAHFVATGDAVPGTVTPGQTYNFEFWAKQISSGPSYEQRYKVSFLADNGVIVTDGIFQPFSPAVGGAWTQYTLNGLVVPAGATSAFIQILGVTGAIEGGLGEVLIDDVSLSGPGLGAPTLFASTTAPAVGISWPSTTGKSVQVQSSLSLSGWTNFGTAVPGNNTIKTVFDAIVDPKKFYRVGELP